jgi:hypothetical protein
VAPAQSSVAILLIAGPKGLGNLAQALAWVALFLRASPVRAPDKAGAIHIDPTQIQTTISSAPSAAPTRHGGCFAPWALQSSTL